MTRSRLIRRFIGDGQYRQSRSIVNDRTPGAGCRPVNSSAGYDCYAFTRFQI